MTHHDGTDNDHTEPDDAAIPVSADTATDESVGSTAEAADYVHPVDHGAGIETEPFASEEEGSYVSGAGNVNSASGLPERAHEKGDYVNPVNHGGGSGDEPNEQAGDYVSPTNR